MHNRLKECIERYPALKVCEKQITDAFEIIKKSYNNKGKLLICGNGGSAADADHIAGELLKSFCAKRNLNNEWKNKLGTDIANNLQAALPAIPLPNLTGIVSAYSNDCNPEYVFAQLTFGLGSPEDTLLCLSTSGNSENILLAAKVARAKGMKTIGLSGQSGGEIKNMVDVCICAPEKETFKIQEYHLPIYHTLCLMLEEEFFCS